MSKITWCQFPPGVLQQTIHEYVLSAGKGVFPKEIAIDLGMSIPTARSYLKAMAKSGLLHAFPMGYRMQAYYPPGKCPLRETEDKIGDTELLTVERRVIEYIRAQSHMSQVGFSRHEIQVALDCGRSTVSKILANLLRMEQIRLAQGSKFGRGLYVYVGGEDVVGEVTQQNGRRNDLLQVVGHGVGIKALMTAILASAVLDLQGDDKKSQTEARKWFRAKQDDYCFSFGAICDHLDIDPEWFMQKIKKGKNWREDP